MRMPFGKHKGEDIRDLPDDYIAWLYGKLGDWRPMLKAVVESEFERRYCLRDIADQQRNVIPARLKPIVERMIQKGWQVLAKKNHPDVIRDDGSAMIDVNRAYEILVKMVEEATFVEKVKT